MNAFKDQEKPGKQPHRTDNKPELTSPVCYANSDEIREEFKDEIPGKADKEREDLKVV